MSDVQVSRWQRARAALGRFGAGLLSFVSFAAPFAVSLAANVTAGLHSGSRVLLVAGIAIPVLLMLAIEMWRRMPRAEGAALVLRSVAMGAPVAVAAGWSWLDTTSLLLAQFPEPWWAQRVLCVAAPLAVDGLAVLSVLSLRSGGASAATASAAGSTVAGAPAECSRAKASPAPTAASPATDSWGPPSTATGPVPSLETSSGLRAVRGTPDVPPSHAAARSRGVPSVPGWTKKTARARCGELGIPQGGTVAALVARIERFERAHPDRARPRATAGVSA